MYVHIQTYTHMRVCVCVDEWMKNQYTVFVFFSLQHNVTQSDFCFFSSSLCNEIWGNKRQTDGTIPWCHFLAQVVNMIYS